MKAMLMCLCLVVVCASAALWRMGSADATEYQAIIQDNTNIFEFEPSYEVLTPNIPPNYMADYCGDSSVNNSNEECDDGNKAAGDGCDSQCQIELPGDVNPDCYQQKHLSCEEAKKACIDDKGTDCYTDYQECLATAVQVCRPQELPDEEPRIPPVLQPEVKTEIPAAGPPKIGVGMSGSGCSLSAAGDPWTLEGFILGWGFLFPLLRSTKRR